MTEERDIEFIHALVSRAARFTKIILGINILVFIVMELAGGTTNEVTLLAFGVKSNAHIDQGEIWRFVTPIFIHIGLLHLLFNSYALWMVGTQVEKLYGSTRFVLLYIVTGVAGVAASYWWHPQDISAGASGAIFGLFGVLLVFGVRYRKSIPPHFQRAVGTGVLPVIAINLIIGFTIPAIDNSAHIGGLLAGALLAAVIPFDRPGTETANIFKLIQAGLILVVAASFFEVGAGYDGPKVSFRNLSFGWSQMTGTQSSVKEFTATINTAQEAFDDSMAMLSSSDPATLKKLDTKLSDSIDALSHIRSVASKPDAIGAGFLGVMQNQYALLQDIRRTGVVTFSHNDQAEQNVRRFNELMKDLNDWVRTDGARYGIVLRRP